MNLARAAIISLAFAALLPVTVPAAWAAGIRPSGHGRDSAIFGTVSSISSQAFVVDGPSATTSVRYDKKTTFEANSAAAATDGFQVNDAVLVQAGPGKQPKARLVIYDTSPFPVGPRREFTGSYAGHTGSSVSIQTKADGTRSFQVNKGTRYVENGKGTSSPTYASGYRLMVAAREYTDGSWVASLVVIKTGKH